MNHQNKREPFHATKTNTRELQWKVFMRFACLSIYAQLQKFWAIKNKKLEFLTHFDHINRLDYVEIPNLSDFFQKKIHRQF